MSQPHPTGQPRVVWITVALVVVAAVVVGAVMIIRRNSDDSSAPKTPSDVYLAALLAPEQTGDDPLTAMAHDNPGSAVDLGNAACTIMRKDLASDPSVYDDSAELLKDVEHQLGTDPHWGTTIQVAGIPMAADFDAAASAAAHAGSLCPEFDAELNNG